MKNLRALLVACILGSSLAACGDSLAAPESPRFSGSTFGGGNRSDSTGAVTTTSTSDSTSFNRSGSTFGGGN